MLNVTGDSKRLLLLAGPQYRIGRHTVTLARKPRSGEPVTVSLIVEIDGLPASAGGRIPPLVMRHIFNVDRDPGAQT